MCFLYFPRLVAAWTRCISRQPPSTRAEACGRCFMTWRFAEWPGVPVNEASGFQGMLQLQHSILAAVQSATPKVWINLPAKYYFNVTCPPPRPSINHSGSLRVCILVNKGIKHKPVAHENRLATSKVSETVKDVLEIMEIFHRQDL